MNSIENISESSSEHEFGFLIDGNRFKDMRRGLDWNELAKAEFHVSVHSPYDLADIRGIWSKKILIKTGYVTTLRVDQVQTKTAEMARLMDEKKRGCRFNDENSELPNFHWYSKFNCLFDCSIEIATKICGCTPWNYPVLDKNVNKLNVSSSRICDFFGNACFNQILENSHFASSCETKCYNDCDDIRYSVSIVREPIDPYGRICNRLGKPNNAMELQTKNHVWTMLRGDGRLEKHNNSSSVGRIMNHLRAILIGNNESSYIDANRAARDDCKQKLNSDIALVIVAIDSPTFSRMKRNVKVTSFDKFALLGKPEYFISPSNNFYKI